MASKGSPMVRVILIVVLGAAALGGAFYFVQARNADMARHPLLRVSTREQAITEVHTILEAIDGYDREKAYYDGIVAACSAEAKGSGGAFGRDLLTRVRDRMKADGKEGTARLTTVINSFDIK